MVELDIGVTANTQLIKTQLSSVPLHLPLLKNVYQ